MRWFRTRRHTGEILPEDIFLDSSNLPQLDAGRLEGRMEHPIAREAPQAIGILFILLVLLFLGQVFRLQILKGEAYAEISRNNRLERSVLFAPRGIVTDRNGKEIAWNEINTDPHATGTPVFPLRHTIEAPGFAHLLGFVRHPKADTKGMWWSEEYEGVGGVEAVFNDRLRGTNGNIIRETDARGTLVRTDIVETPRPGATLALSIDADVQEALARQLLSHAETQGFQGGAGLIMDVESGELLAMVSFPEYNLQAFAEGNSEIIDATNNDVRTPLLNRAVAGLYAPGSIVKPFMALAALEENLIDPEKEIYSAGFISIPNPYVPEKPSIFKDWKAHGWVDMRRALAVSSDVYFYAIGGGFEDQKGLGIEKIDEYARRFGLGEPTGFAFPGELPGTIPTPEWKQEIFDDEWRLGDTYNTAIGQYGFQVTPMQIIRFVGSLANGGTLVMPHLVKGEKGARAPIGVSEENLSIIREGMRAAVVEGGTGAALNMGGIDIAAKTGTAQVGARNQFMNSWVIGFWPFEKPRYAFAVVLERAPANTLSGASPAMAPFFYWLREHKPEYLQ